MMRDSASAAKRCQRWRALMLPAKMPRYADAKIALMLSDAGRDDMIR